MCQVLTTVTQHKIGTQNIIPFNFSWTLMETFSAMYVQYQKPESVISAFSFLQLYI